MKLSLKWLKDYVSVGVSAQDLAHRLTLAGFEVEKISSENGDTVFELEVTPNRPDCLNIIGLAREISAIFNKTLRLPKIAKVKFPARRAQVTIDDKKGCRRYIGILIRNVKIGESPKWLKDRMEALGIRSINNVVDITNFCLMELGQPLHAFDYDKLIGGKVIVRRARDGEKIMTIDGGQCTLDSSILVVADSQQPVAIAGIMGGQATEVGDKTKNIFLESAYFDPILIRRAARRLGLSSDSSYRFERGVDFEIVPQAVLRAVSLIKEMAGGVIEQRADVMGVKWPQGSRVINISTQHINSLLGTNFSAAQCKNLLQKLRLNAKVKKDRLSIKVPGVRADIKEEVDIIEEVARIVGYDRLPSSIPVIKVSSVKPSQRRQDRSYLRNILMTQGLNEIVTYTMYNLKQLSNCGLADLRGIKIQNPLTQDQEFLRPALLPSFLSVAALNFNQGQKDLRLFEMGKIYLPSGERETLGILMSGIRHDDWRLRNKEEVNFYDMKGIVERLCESYGCSEIGFQEKFYPAFESAVSAIVDVNGQEFGIVGKLNREILERWDIKHKNICFAQIDLEILYKSLKQNRQYQPLPEFPAVVRDVSLAIRNNIKFSQIKTIIQSRGADILTQVRFIDEYVGDKIPSGHRGVTLSLTYQSMERTLREEEITSIHERICSALVEQLAATRR